MILVCMGGESWNQFYIRWRNKKLGPGSSLRHPKVMALGAALLTGLAPRPSSVSLALALRLSSASQFPLRVHTHQHISHVRWHPRIFSLPLSCAFSSTLYPVYPSLVNRPPTDPVQSPCAPGCGSDLFTAPPSSPKLCQRSRGTSIMRI